MSQTKYRITKNERLQVYRIEARYEGRNEWVSISGVTYPDLEVARGVLEFMITNVEEDEKKKHDTWTVVM